MRVAGNTNTMESLKNFRKKNVRETSFYPSLPHVINHDIFITPPCPLEPNVINGRPFTDGVL